MVDLETLGKIIKVTLSVGIVTAGASFGVAKSTAKAEIAPTVVRVGVIEIDHLQIRQQINNVEVLSRYQTKILENIMITNGVSPTVRRPRLYRLNGDGGVVEDDL
jgi:hypothetical protein